MIQAHGLSVSTLLQQVKETEQIYSWRFWHGDLFSKGKYWSTGPVKLQTDKVIRTALQGGILSEQRAS